MRSQGFWPGYFHTGCPRGPILLGGYPAGTWLLLTPSCSICLVKLALLNNLKCSTNSLWMNTRENIFSVYDTQCRASCLFSASPCWPGDTHIYVCLAEDFNCGESHYNTIMGEVNGLYLSEHEIKFWTFCFLTCSPSPFSAPNFQNLSLLLSFFVPC